MFNNPYDRYNQPYARSTKYGPILSSPFLGAPPPFIPTSALSRRSDLAGGYPYGAVQRRGPFPPPVLYPAPIGYYPWQDCLHKHCESSCDQTQATAHRREYSNLKTKDVVIRGKAFAVRASYLQELPKFEKELREYLDKKDEDTIPERVINMLFAFINEEEYCNGDPYDEVTLCILAHNAGSKSVVNYSLDQIKKIEGEIHISMLVDIIITIMRSSDVPDLLKDWLEKFMRTNVDWHTLGSDPDFITKIVHQCPETYTDLLVLLGFEGKRPSTGSRIL